MSVLDYLKRLPESALSASSWLVWTALVFEFVIGLFTGQYTSSFIALGTFLLTLVPVVLAHRTDLYIPKGVTASMVLFIFATLFLGEIGNYYDRFWWWDTMLHGGSAIGFGLLGFVFIFMLFQGDRYAAPPWAVGFFAFCFAMSIGAIWEIFEFAMDHIFGLNMQKSGLVDTMWDLILDAIGGLIGASAGAIYMAREEGGLFGGVLREVITRNRRYFRKYRSSNDS